MGIRRFIPEEQTALLFQSVDFEQGVYLNLVETGDPLDRFPFFHDVGFEPNLFDGLKGFKIFKEELSLSIRNPDFVTGIIRGDTPSRQFRIEILDLFHRRFSGPGNEL